MILVVYCAKDLFRGGIVCGLFNDERFERAFSIILG